jgi:DNA-damage-inducible protein J
MTDCIVRSRIDPKMKQKAVKMFEHMGLTLSEAIRIFIYQSVAEHKIPFSINIPNATTRAAMQEVEEKKHLKKTSLKQLKKDWDDACEK